MACLIERKFSILPHKLIERPKKEHPQTGSANSSGDGGNRTRVRKIRPLNVYKLSQPIFFSWPGPRPTGSPRPQADGSRKSLLASHIDIREEHVDIYDAWYSPGQRAVEADAVPLSGTLPFISLIQRREERYMQSCFRHFCVCFQFYEM